MHETALTGGGLVQQRDTASSQFLDLISGIGRTVADVWSTIDSRRSGSGNNRSGPATGAASGSFPVWIIIAGGAVLVGVLLLLALKK